MNLLHQEYNNYKTSLRIQNLKNAHYKIKKFYINAIERFFLRRALLYEPHYSFHKINMDIDKPLFDELDKELTKKKEFLNMEPNEVIKNIKKEINDNANNTDKKYSKLEIEYEGINIKTITYKDFTLNVYKRIDVLLKKSLNICKTLTAIFRYLSIASGGQHCALPLETYKILYSKYNVKNEGFASPFNSRFIEFSDKECKFGSLFLDTDKVFGSIGPFALKNLIDKKNKYNWTVNPPYFNEIIDPSCDIVLEALEILEKRKEKRFFLYMMPNWIKDSKGLQKLNNSPFYHQTIILPAYTTYIECSNNRIIETKTDTALTILATSKMKPELNIDEIEIINSTKYTKEIQEKKKNTIIGIL